MNPALLANRQVPRIAARVLGDVLSEGSIYIREWRRKTSCMCGEERQETETGYYPPPYDILLKEAGISLATLYDAIKEALQEAVDAVSIVDDGSGEPPRIEKDKWLVGMWRGTPVTVSFTHMGSDWNDGCCDHEHDLYELRVRRVGPEEYAKIRESVSYLKTIETRGGRP